MKKFLTTLILLIFLSTAYGQQAMLLNSTAPTGPPAPTDYWAHWFIDDFDNDGDPSDNVSAISNIVDLSGNGRDMADDNSSASFSWVDNVLNGYGGLVFTSSTDQMSTYSDADFIDTLDAVTIAMVLIPEEGENALEDYSGVMFTDEGFSYYGMYRSSDYGETYSGSFPIWTLYTDAGNLFALEEPIEAVSGSPLIILYTFDAANDSLKLATNVTPIRRGTTSFSYPDFKFPSVSNYEWSLRSINGVDTLLEVRVFDRVLTDVEYASTISDLSTKYNITEATTIEKVRNGIFDVEQHTGDDGNVEVNSVDLQINTEDGSTASQVQTIGLQYLGVPIPQGATINSAYIQFKLDASRAETTGDADIYGEDADNATAFSGITNNASNDWIDNLTWTTAKVDWDNIDGSGSIGDATATERTPDLKTIIQEIVDRAGWASGNNITIIFEKDPSGDIGRAEYDSYEGGAANAPVLTIKWSL